MNSKQILNFAPGMDTFTGEIAAALAHAGIRYGIARAGHPVSGQEYITGRSASGGISKAVLPVRICANSPAEAEEAAEMYGNAVAAITEDTGERPVIITQDRWACRREMMTARLLAHLGLFTPVYARNCEIRRIGKTEASAFLAANHSYGDAACRYRYGMFLRRHTGHIANGMRCGGTSGTGMPLPGTMVAAAEFSNARKWIKDGQEIRSYEWTRYASLPGVRVCGGMGKMLQAFISETGPDDIMSYADIEWSDGNVYDSLGFSLEAVKSPVMFMIDGTTYRRTAIRPGSQERGTDARKGNASRTGQEEGNGQEDNGATASTLYFRNWGSYKYRLKLTDYR